MKTLILVLMLTLSFASHAEDKPVWKKFLKGFGKGLQGAGQGLQDASKAQAEASKQKSLVICTTGDNGQTYICN